MSIGRAQNPAGDRLDSVCSMSTVLWCRVIYRLFITENIAWVISPHDHMV